MLNKKLKQETIKELKRLVSQYEEKFEDAIKNSTELHESRVKSINHIQEVENFMNSLANRPMAFDAKLNEININKRKFSDEVSKINKEEKNIKVKAGAQVGAGIAGGVGVAALGPAAAMAVATTFGTASTGTAIATLSGAAATKAALAWLGGGALIAGGNGIVGGTAFLALAGPVGIAIGGATIAGAGVFTMKKNKKIAEKAEAQIIEIRKEITGVANIETLIDALGKRTKEFLSKNRELFQNMEETYPRDYKSFTLRQKRTIGSLVNNTHAMSKLIIQKVGE